MVDKINRITNTPIINHAYHGYSLAQDGFHNKNTCVRQPDGTLWAIPALGSSELHLFRSTDDGFSWVDISDLSGTWLRDEALLNTIGPIDHLCLNKTFDILDVYMGARQVVGGPDIERIRLSISGADTDTVSITTVRENAVEGTVDVSYNLEEFFITYVDASNDLTVFYASPRSAAYASDDALTEDPVFTLFSTCVNKESVLQIIYMSQNGGTSNQIHTVTWDPDNSFGTPVLQVNFGVTTKRGHDFAIAYDGLGNVMAFYGNIDESAETMTNDYIISKDAGVSWSSPVSLTRTSGHTAYNDPNIASWPSARNAILGAAEGGWMIMYTEDDANGKAKTYVRRVTTSDSGATYTVGDEKQIATSEDQSKEVIGGLFFNPTGTKLMEMTDPGLVRVAYQVGEGSAEDGDDIVPVKIGQELLYESAFPTPLSTETGSYTYESEDPTRAVLLKMVIYSGPSANVDFYTNGMTGAITTKYTNAFNRIGTVCRFLRYEPDSNNFMNDRSAYDSPTESYAQVIFEPVTYGDPAVELVAGSQSAWVEQDIRKVFLPPAKHLARTYSVNDGGYLKRTVWLMEFDGNQYEITQVVPRFHSNQITHYEANAYVLGPSRDPFSRAVLPSET